MQENQNTNGPAQTSKATLVVARESAEPAPLEISTAATTEAKEETTTPSTQPQTTNSQSQTEYMEVHKHPHHVIHKKKWNEYLLEFSCFFLLCS